MARRRKKKSAESATPQAPADKVQGEAVTSLKGLLKAALKTPDAPTESKPQPQFRELAPPPRLPKSPPAQAAAKPEGEPERPLDARDMRLLNDAYDGATPLGQTARKSFKRAARRAPTPPLAPPKSESSDDQVRKRLGALVGGGVRFTVVDDGVSSEALREGVSRRELRRLRSPNFRAEATLDLHGELRAAVELKVNRFVREHQRRGCRYLLVIHGKGLHSENGEGVLGEAVLAALTGGGAAPLVRAATHAHEQLGGRGATAVALM